MEEVDAAEYHEWLALYQKEPFGELREDMRAAKQIQATIAPYVKKSPTLGDCMLYPPEKPDMDGRSLMGILRAYTEAMGGEVK